MGRKKQTGFTMQKRGSTWYVYHRYNPDGKLQGVCTKCKDKVTATKWAIDYIWDLRNAQVMLTIPGDATVDMPQEMQDIGKEMQDIEASLIDEINTAKTKYFDHLYKNYSSQDIAGRVNLLTVFCKFICDRSITKWSHVHEDTIEKFFKTVSINISTRYAYSIRIKAFCTWMIENKYIDKPFIDLSTYKLSKRQLKETQKKIVPLTCTDITSIQEVLKEHDRDYLFFNILLHTGMRQGELFNLLWCNVDIQNKIIYVKPNKPNDKLGIVKYGLKTLASDRPIPIKDCLIPMLTSAKENSNGNVYVIPTRSKIRDYYTWNDLLMEKVAKFRPDFTPHLTRHTYITRAIVVGKHSIFLVAKWAGDSVQMITETYGHFYNAGDINNF